MGGGPESRCVGRVYGLDGAVRQSTKNCVNCYLFIYLFLFTDALIKIFLSTPQKRIGGIAT